MKTKILVVMVAMALYACGGETKSSETSDSVEVESSIDSMAMEVDTAMTLPVDSVEIDSLGAEIDSSTVE